MKVSVIIPTHNSERTLEKALMSVVNQRVECEIEIILCDDHSADFKWLKNIASIYGCMLIKTIGTGGPNFGRNLGMKYATGNVIAFLDHDDEWMPWKIKKQLEEIRNGAEFVYSPGITRKG